jgi:phosphate transport system substrate-binding protein
VYQAPAAFPTEQFDRYLRLLSLDRGCVYHYLRTSTVKVLKRSALILVCLIHASLLALVVACMAAPPHKPVQIEMVGSDSMQWISHALADVYTKEHPYVTLKIQASNSAAGLRATREYSGTIGLVSRTVKPEEIEQSRALVVARDGIAIVVHPSNPINAILRSQLVQVFSGEIGVWPIGPQSNKPIAVVSREDGSGTRDAFEKMAMNGARVTRTAIMMPNEVAVIDFVARNPAAIGYSSMGAVTPEVRALSVEDVPLTTETVESQKYPFVRTLAFIVPMAPSIDLQDFINFVRGSEGQKLIGQKYGRAP